MSLTTYLVLLNRDRIDVVVLPKLAEVLGGASESAIQALKRDRRAVAANLDSPPEGYFESIVRLALDVLEGRLTQAYVGELSPPVVNPAEAWPHNVNSLVRGLVLALCAERHVQGYPAALAFRFRPSALILEASPAMGRIVDDQDPALVQAARTGVFEGPEYFLKTDTCTRITGEIQSVVDALPNCETEETVRGSQHFYTIVAAAANDKSLALLKGYL